MVRTIVFVSFSVLHLESRQGTPPGFAHSCLTFGLSLEGCSSVWYLVHTVDLELVTANDVFLAIFFIIQGEQRGAVANPWAASIRSVRFLRGWYDLPAPGSLSPSTHRSNVPQDRQDLVRAAAAIEERCAASIWTCLTLFAHAPSL